VAVNGAGNVLVADTGNSCIRNASTGRSVTTLAATNFVSPSGVVVDRAGNIFVADTGNHAIQEITPAGTVTTLAGTPGSSGSADGVGAAATFNHPFGVAVDGSGKVFVADTGNHTIRMITPTGAVTTLAGTLGSSGGTDGVGAAASFNQPSGVAADGAGNVFVADTGNHTIRKITPAGAVTTLAGTAGASGSADGVGAVASFNQPSGVAADGAGNVFVADTGNHTIRKITPAGAVTTLAGTPGVAGSWDGTGATSSFAARFDHPTGLAVDEAGNVFVADTGNNTIRMITPAGTVTTLAGASREWGSADGTGAVAYFAQTSGVAVDEAGNIFVADMFNHTIRKITPAGAVTTLAGTPGSPGSADGTGAAAGFFYPRGVAVDGAGNVLVVDSGNYTIRKITSAGTVTTLAGAPGSYGSTDGTGAAARFSQPEDVAVDRAGNAFVAESFDNTIRKITPAGVVTTFAGTPGSPGSADGVGAAARFASPTGVAVDRAGNVFVADYGNNTIRKITPAGVVTTFAGTPGSWGSADGVGAAARFYDPNGVAADGAGNIFVAQRDNNTIRKITPDGVVSTVVGTPASTTAGNVPGPLPASLWGPLGVAVSPSSGSIYITVDSAVMVATW
jgi:sugar lactone lactonase YvrE